MVFIGPLFDKESESEIRNNTPGGAIQNQANNYQWNCINGLIVNGIRVNIINVLPVGSYPKGYKELVLRSRAWEYKDTPCQEVGCINLPVFKQIIRSYKIKRIFKQFTDETVLVYSTYYPFLRAIKCLASTNKVVLIVTDLPEYYDYSTETSTFKRLLRRVNNHLIYRSLDRVDGYILLTKEMCDRLNIGQKPFEIIEGICDKTYDIAERTDNSNKKIVLYTGSLNERFGIRKLIDAFQLINNDQIFLHLCGSGDCENYIKKNAENNKRIVFEGYLPYKEVVKKQLSADVLVNPRQNDENYTKYSFPSKTMDYLLSGVPTIAYKLDGIPDEYDPYINYVGDNSIEALAQMIGIVCNDSTGKYKEKAQKAKRFIETEKNIGVQAKKIITLCDVL